MIVIVLLLLKGNMSKTNSNQERIHQEFVNVVREEMDNKQFWNWVCQWLDSDSVIKIAEQWETLLKQETIDVFRKGGYN